MRCRKIYGAKGATNDVTIWRIRVACWLSKVTCTYAHSHAHALGLARARAHTHTQICNIYYFSTATIIRKRDSMLCYTYIVFFKLYEEVRYSPGKFCNYLVRA